MTNNFPTLGGVDREEALRTLHDDVTLPFDLQRLSRLRSPLAVGAFETESNLWPHRINQCLVKTQRANSIDLGPFESDILRAHIESCVHISEQLDLDWRSRFLYVTVDTAAVTPGLTQRVPGWHFDDLQGADIGVKKPGGFLFVAASSLPTEFAIQPFDMHGVDDRVHNVFRWCERQVRHEHVHTTWPQTINLMSAYDVHRGVPATKAGPRVFVRLLFTNCLLTSAKTTINPAFGRDLQPHSTDGKIPTHLV